MGTRRTPMVEIKQEKITPVCPFCEARLDKLLLVKTGWFNTNRVYCCPRCHKIVNQRIRKYNTTWPATSN